MAWRLKLVPDNTNINFFAIQWLTFGASVVAVIGSLILWATVGLNYGIDFRGGTTIRTESTSPVDIAAYRATLETFGFSDVAVTEVFDPAFRDDQHVAQVRLSPIEGEEAVTPEVIAQVEAALQQVDPSITFPSVESVGPKVSQELIWTAFLSVAAAIVGILVYVWLRFEWQFSVGAVAALFHDVVVTVGIFVIFQIKFDLTTVAALLTILGYSVNDTVVIFDRLRENLIKYKQRSLRDLMNLSANETLSRTIMTAGTALIALAVLLLLGGDVIRGFIFAMFVGVILGTYSTLYVAKNIVLMLGVKRNWSKEKDGPSAGTQFGKSDA
jgi:preprotein translocase subunit SecF